MFRGDGLCCCLARLCSLCLQCVANAAATACTWFSAATDANAKVSLAFCNRWTLCSLVFLSRGSTRCQSTSPDARKTPDASSGGLLKLHVTAEARGWHRSKPVPPCSSPMIAPGVLAYGINSASEPVDRTTGCRITETQKFAQRLGQRWRGIRDMRS